MQPAEHQQSHKDMCKLKTVSMPNDPPQFHDSCERIHLEGSYYVVFILVLYRAISYYTRVYYSI